LIKRPVISVRLPSSLSERIGSRGEIIVEGRNVEECLKYASEKFPDLEKIIWPEKGQLNPAILIFHKEEPVINKNLKQTVSDGDQVDIIPAISGGKYC